MIITQTTKYDEIGKRRVTTTTALLNNKTYSVETIGFGGYSADCEITYNTLEELNNDYIDYNCEYGQALRNILSQSEYADNFGEHEETESLRVWE